MRFGSVGGGGRYDGLVSRFRGEPVPATGFSIGVSRLQAALTALGKLEQQSQRPAPCVVTVFGSDDGRLPEARCRRCATPASAPSFISAIRNTASGSRLKYADRRGSPCAVIQGSMKRSEAKCRSRT